MTGRCALLIQAGYSRDAAAVNYVSNRLDVFVQLDNVGAEIVAKTLHPLMGKTADSNFAETDRFLGQVSHVAESNGTGRATSCHSTRTTWSPTVRTRFLPTSPIRSINAPSCDRHGRMRQPIRPSESATGELNGHQVRQFDR